MAFTKFSQFIRSFSATHPRFRIAKLPTQVYGIAGRYATALYSAGLKKNMLEAIESELTNLQKTLREDKALKEFMKTPIINRITKSDALKAAAAKVKLSEPTSNLLQVLAENNRLKSLNAVINSYKTIMAAHRGEVVCLVTVAKSLDENQKKRLEDVLKSQLKGGQTIHITINVNPSLIGGMTVSIDDRFVDMSVVSKIKKFTELISEAA